MKTFYTSKEISELLKIDNQVILRWLREGKLVGLKLGKVWRVEDKDLEAFLEKAREEGQAHRLEELNRERDLEDDQEEEDFVSVRRVSSLLGVSPRTLQYKLKQGTIKGEQKGPLGKWWIPREELERLLDEKSKTSGR